jgi:hypothetical protein
MRRVLLTAALGLAGLMAIPSYAQYNSGWYGGNDRGNGRWQNGRYDESANKAYQQGYKDGVWDTQHGPTQRSRYWNDQDDARAYRDGYNAGYRGYRGSNGGYNNGHSGSWGNNRGYGNGSYGYGGSGRGNYAQQGYIDGQTDGSNDRRTGHSYRPTEHPGWDHQIAATTAPWALANKTTSGCTVMPTRRDINAGTMDVKRDAI